MYYDWEWPGDDFTSTEGIEAQSAQSWQYQSYTAAPEYSHTSYMVSSYTPHASLSLLLQNMCPTIIMVHEAVYMLSLIELTNVTRSMC